MNKTESQPTPVTEHMETDDGSLTEEYEVLNDDVPTGSDTGKPVPTDKSKPKNGVVNIKH